MLRQVRTEATPPHGLPPRRKNTVRDLQKRGPADQILYHPRFISDISSQTTGKRRTGRPTGTIGAIRREPDNRPYVRASIGARQFKALIDTGVVSSLVSKNVASWCRDQGWITARRPYVATLADGSNKEIGESLTGRLAIAGQSSLVKVLVLPDLDYPLIIEMDILRELGLRLYIDDKPIYPLAERHAVGAAGLIGMEDQERAQLDEIIRQEKERYESI
jgi:hypothetical protein